MNSPRLTKLSWFILWCVLVSLKLSMINRLYAELTNRTILLITIERSCLLIDTQICFAIADFLIFIYLSLSFPIFLSVSLFFFVYVHMFSLLLLIHTPSSLYIFLCYSSSPYLSVRFPGFPIVYDLILSSQVKELLFTMACIRNCPLCNPYYVVLSSLKRIKVILIRFLMIMENHLNRLFLGESELSLDLMLDA